jgi:hypothetical protein
MKKTLAVVGILAGAMATYAQVNIANLDTGAGLFALNNTPNVLIDPNWTVTLFSISNSPPPGGIPTGAAYLVPNNIGFPFPHWAANSATSSWISYANPQNADGWFTGGDTTQGTYQYQLQFTAASTGVDTLSWLSDNGSSAYLNGTLLGSWGDADYSDAIMSPAVNLNLTGGSAYTLDIDVYNDFQYAQNPTGVNAQLAGPVLVTPVPEPSSLALMLLSGGGMALGAVRRKFGRKSS